MVHQVEAMVLVFVLCENPVCPLLLAGALESSKSVQQDMENVALHLYHRILYKVDLVHHVQQHLQKLRHILDKYSHI
jgi:hypothetical protein